MKLSNCIVLAYSICISTNVVFVKSENNTSDHNISSNATFEKGKNDTNILTNQDATDYHIELHPFISKMLQDSFLKEFSLIMKNKNEEIRSLNEQIVEKDKIIQQFQPSTSTKTTNGSPPLNHLESWALKDFVKKRLRNVFEKELNDIIKEKNCQIYLLTELLKEKENTVALQRRVRQNPKIATYGPMGIGEPSWEI
ncbi:uncharacterized protein LOC135839620 [Planococcus citri]|uniref:uncharacterized protein LOC135839620 n=1 Tax=Planococcus citri TaxID=170843 RepID=UPI0031F9561F